MPASSALPHAALAPAILRMWLRRGPMACVLWPLSLLFALLVGLRRLLYRFGIFNTIHLPVPVIVVGNLFVGGTGKTPLTIWLVDALRQAGYHPGVISRGYGSKHAGVQRVTATSSAHALGDEPVLIAQRTGCPLMVGRDRVAAGQALLVAHPEVDVILSDDGLQHYRLGRTIEIVLSDLRGDGNGWLLPAGPLRESRRRQRDFSVVNVGSVEPAPPMPPGTGAGSIVMQLRAPLAEQLMDRGQRTTLAAIAAAAPPPVIIAAAGMGNPARFFATLSGAGLDFAPMPLPDHHVFTSDTFADWAADLILVTEKDAVKCREITALASDARLWVVPVSAYIAAPFADYIVERLRGHPTA